MGFCVNSKLCENLPNNVFGAAGKIVLSRPSMKTETSYKGMGGWMNERIGRHHKLWDSSRMMCELNVIVRSVAWHDSLFQDRIYCLSCDIRSRIQPFSSTWLSWSMERNAPYFCLINSNGRWFTHYSWFPFSSREYEKKGLNILFSISTNIWIISSGICNLKNIHSLELWTENGLCFTNVAVLFNS